MRIKGFMALFIAFFAIFGANAQAKKYNIHTVAFYNLENAWQIGTNPTITYNDKSSSDNKWDVPIGITVAKTTKIGAVPVKFQLGAEYFVVNQEDYGSRFQIKLNIIPVIPALVKKPLL